MLKAILKAEKYTRLMELEVGSDDAINRKEWEIERIADERIRKEGASK